MIRTYFAIAAAIAVSACASTPAAPTKVDGALAAKATSDIRNKLRDPSSGEFRNFRAYDIANGERSVCANVNAANGMGGLTGFQDVVIIYRGDQHTVFFDDLAAYECANLARGTSARI